MQPSIMYNAVIFHNNFNFGSKIDTLTVTKKTKRTGKDDNGHGQKAISTTPSSDTLIDRTRHSSPTIRISERKGREKYFAPSISWENESRNENSLEVSELKLLLPGIKTHMSHKSATGEENHFTENVVESTSEYSSVVIEGNNHHATSTNDSKYETNKVVSSKTLDTQMGDGQALKPTSNPSEISDSRNGVTSSKQLSTKNVNQARLQQLHRLKQLQQSRQRGET